MKYAKTLLLCTSLVAMVGAFQNCGKKSFSDGSQSASSQDPASASNAGSSGDSTNATSSSGGLDPAKSYVLTCQSLAGKTQTLPGTVGSDPKTLIAMAPSGEGVWVINVANGSITSSYNCFADQALAQGAQPQSYGVTACMSYAGRSCSAFGTCTYAQGAANPFANCTFK